MKPAYRLMLITQLGNQSIPSYLSFIKTCVKHGITSVQLREKHLSFSDLIYFSLKLQEILVPLHIPLIINDHLPLARHIHADGIHLGQEDIHPSVAYQHFGKNKIFGLSIESEEQFMLANQNSLLTYIAASAVFPTPNKNNLKKFWGIEGLSVLAQRSLHPVIAIGGITLANVKEVMLAGAAGLAIIGAVHNAKNPAQICQQLRETIDAYS